jgi:hypothetical protein
MKHFLLLFLISTVSISSIQSSILYTDSSLIQYFSFDSISGGTVYDGSAFGNDGTMSNTISVIGKLGNGLELNNTNSFINGGVVPQVSNFTVMAWIKPYTYGNANNNNILVFENTESYYMNIMCVTTGNRTRGKMRVGLQRASGGWEYLDSPNLIELNKWTHATYTFDGIYLRLYINGVLASSKESSALLSKSKPMVWGAVYKETTGYNEIFSGKLDECMLFSRPLTATEIKDYYDKTVFISGIPEGMTQIFNGVDLSGWTRKGNTLATWDIIDGMLRPRQPAGGGGAGWIQYNKQFTDFTMYCEWKATKDGDFQNQAANNGIQFHLAENSTNPVWDAIEIQIADDDNYSLWYNKDGYTIGDTRELSGSVYGIVGINKKVYNGTNNWNSFLLTSIGDSIKLHYNNELVLNINRNNYANSFYMWGQTRTALASRPRAGYIALQSHRGADVYLRNVAIKDLSGTTNIQKQNVTSGLSVFPNPANGSINIKSDNFKFCELYDANGVKIIRSYNNILTVKNLKYGVYLLRVVDTDNFSQHQKVIIQ